MDRAYLKQKAKDQIRGNMGVLIVMMIIMAAASYLSGLTVVLSIVVIPALTLALTSVYLKLTEGVKPKIGDIFSRFNDFWPALKLSLLSGIYTFLWSLLLIIPGIIKAFAYSQAMYIIAEEPNIGTREALRRSEEMMVGHKAEYFVLQLSFIGWRILSAFTFGILTLWLVPYMNATMANYYQELKGRR